MRGFWVRAPFLTFPHEKTIVQWSNLPLISGKYGLRNHFWPLESVFLMRKSEKRGPNFWGEVLPILRLTFLELCCNFRKYGFKKWWVFMGVNFIVSWLPSISWKVAIETNQRGIFTHAWWISLMHYVKSFFSNKLSILVEINVFKEERGRRSHSLVLY